ncbi:MAG: S1C family serine protease [Acidimicrobiales bacterium]
MAPPDRDSHITGSWGPDDPDPRGQDRPPTGWVPPDQRAWRHPSELGAALPRSSTSGPRTALGRVAQRNHTLGTVLVGMGALVLLAGGSIMLATQSSAPGTPPPLVSAEAPAHGMGSVVRLAVLRPDATGYGCGLVVAKGGLVATDATLLAGASRVVVTDASGRRQGARVVAVDPSSDIGLVRVSGPLPVARVVDWSALEPGAGTVEMTLSPEGTGEPKTVFWNETIDSPSDDVASGPASGLVGVIASTPHGTSPDGAVLMLRDGTVVGLLDNAGVPAVGGGSVFLSASFVVQVARELVAGGGHIQHGWLGILGSDVAGNETRGARVTEVDPTGPAEGRLLPGDLIVGIDGRPVRSMADLRSRLYMLGSRAAVNLEVLRNSASLDVRLQLAPSP